MAQTLRVAAARGAKVTLILDGQSPRIYRSNRKTARYLNAQGINTELSAYPLHAKIAIVDRTVYWSDRN
jgi:phosphatidylserine/phosphatidylglycerophosphate/cardiolipin synthase-like enzyme